MEKRYEEVLNKIEELNGYELALSRIFNEIILGEKKLSAIENEFLMLNDTYQDYWDMLYSLKIDDEKLEVIKKLFENIFLYENIKEMISETNTKNEIVNEIDSRLLHKNKHTENLLYYIFKNEGITHDSLAEKLQIKKDNLTHTIDSIIKYDLIYKVKDGRINYYYLTKLGMKYYKLIEKEKEKYSIANDKYYVEDDIDDETFESESDLNRNVFSSKSSACC